ncbi:hypothetical protein FRC19_011277 [Serendipita sp. 401]|nr:hypothetical protein FRC19_011277 [Serendipita sp. 401]
MDDQKVGRKEGRKETGQTQLTAACRHQSKFKTNKIIYYLSFDETNPHISIASEDVDQEIGILSPRIQGISLLKTTATDAKHGLMRAPGMVTLLLFIFQTLHSHRLYASHGCKPQRIYLYSFQKTQEMKKTQICTD